MQHVEQTYLVRMLLTLRKKEKKRSCQKDSPTNLCLIVYLLPPPPPACPPLPSLPSLSLHLKRILTCQTTLMLADCRWCTSAHALDCSWMQRRVWSCVTMATPRWPILTSLMDFMCPPVPAFSQRQINLEEAHRVRTKKNKNNGERICDSYILG